ncbi:hypothetical protein NST83_22365 [Paenibacillus sp. FSL R10-2782]|uniref:hypothetical protein n=1 Tax=Paenibacillus sp. FSL R10-2782 TaxID=2954661 RepID=UPI0031585552
MKKILSKARKAIVPILIVLMLIYVYVGNIGKYSISILQETGSKTVGEITEGLEFGQTFQADVNDLSGVSIKLATYMRENTGDVTVGLRLVGDHKDIYSTTVDAKSIQDNQFFKLRFPPIKNSKGKKYYLYVNSTGTQGHSITAYKADNNPYKQGELFINNKKQAQDDLTFIVYYNKTFLDWLV